MRDDALDECISTGALALRLDAIVRGQAEDTDRRTLKNATTDQLVRFTRVNADTIRKRSLYQLKASLALSPDLARRVQSHLEDDDRAQWRFLIGDLDLSQIAEWLDSDFRDPATRLPPAVDAQIMAHLAQQTNHAGLTQMVTLWQRNQNPAAWQETLHRISPNEYQELAGIFLRHQLDLLDLLVDNKADIWMSTSLDQLPPQSLLSLARRLLAIESSDVLVDQLAGRVKEMSQADRSALKKLLKPNPTLAPALWSAITGRLSKEPRGCKSWFLGRRKH